MRAYPTATLRQLARRRRLESSTLIPSEANETVARKLRDLLAAPDGLAVDALDARWLTDLERSFLITRSPAPQPRPGLPFAFVEAINFELTYGCNLACSHCLQDALRPTGKIPWIDRELVATALEDADWLGLLGTGVNFTGGEIFLPGSPVLELIVRAAELGLQVRANTNAWWGGRQDFTVGSRRFSSDRALVEHLRDTGLTVLALSLDERYDQYPELFDRFMRVVELCEIRGQPYQFVATDVPQHLRARFGEALVRRFGQRLKFAFFSSMETVDVGAAAQPAAEPLRPTTLAALTLESPCERKGFHRPHFLHVNPDGGVRSCMYAPGADVLGVLGRERLPQILNRADRNPVVRLFADGDLDAFVERSITPWQHLYRAVRHPCSASALIARVAGALGEARDRLGRDLDMPELEEIHRTIARELNISASPDPVAR